MIYLTLEPADKHSSQSIEPMHESSTYSIFSPKSDMSFHLFLIEAILVMYSGIHKIVDLILFS